MSDDVFPNLRLTRKEEEIMTILWDAKKPLTVSDILDHSKTMKIEINQSTTQMLVNKLLKSGIIRVGEITQAHKVLARAFEPIMSSDEFAVSKFKQAIYPSGGFPISGLFAALLNHVALSEKDIKELSDMIEELKKK